MRKHKQLVEEYGSKGDKATRWDPQKGGADIWETAEKEEILNPRSNGQVDPPEDYSKEQCLSAQGSVRAEPMIIHPSLYRALSTICTWMASLCLYLPQREFLCLY